MTKPVSLRAEGEKARAWRERQDLSRPALGDMVGYSPSAVLYFERGFGRNGKPVSPRSFLTYKLACAAVASQLAFDWGDVTIRL